MTIKLAKVKDPYLEPSQTSMSSFEKIVNGLEKNSWKKLYHRYMIPNTLLTILRCQESQTFCLLWYIKSCSFVIKCSPFYQR